VKWQLGRRKVDRNRILGDEDTMGKGESDKEKYRKNQRYKEYISIYTQIKLEEHLDKRGLPIAK